MSTSELNFENHGSIANSSTKSPGSAAASMIVTNVVSTNTNSCVRKAVKPRPTTVQVGEQVLICPMPKRRMMLDIDVISHIEPPTLGQQWWIDAVGISGNTSDDSNASTPSVTALSPPPATNHRQLQHYGFRL